MVLLCILLQKMLTYKEIRIILLIKGAVKIMRLILHMAVGNLRNHRLRGFISGFLIFFSTVAIIIATTIGNGNKNIILNRFMTIVLRSIK